MRKVAQRFGDNTMAVVRVQMGRVVVGTLCVDHICMCLTIHPKYSVSTIVGSVKGESAMILFEKYSRLEKTLDDVGFGYLGITSVPLTWMKGSSGVYQESGDQRVD